MTNLLIKALEKTGLLITAKAHCDVPCGIYDTGPALYHAVSVVRLMDQFLAADDSAFLTKARLVAQKEEQAEKVKHEIRVIWGDYVKAPIVEKYPNIHELAHSIMTQGSKCKQDCHREDGEKLVELVNEFAEIFWATKGVATGKAPCPYEPKLPVVYPKLEG